MRTFRGADWRAAQQAWDDGGFGWRWQSIRRIAAERGFIYPPSGSAEDDRDVDNPSQRAVIYRAIEDNPTHLEAIVKRSRSWYEVVDGIIGLETRLRADADDDDRMTTWEREQRPDGREATAVLADIMRRIGDSL